MRIKRSALLIATVVLAACGDAASPTAPQSPASTTTIASLAIDAETVQGGTATQGAVTLSEAAPAGGFTVTLSSNDTAVSVPASVTVAAGSTSASFAITTSAVAASTDVVISATAGGVTRSATLRVTASETAVPLVGLSSAHDDIVGGTDSTGTIGLASPAPSDGTRVTLVSGHASLEVPASITIPAGARSGSFDIKTRAVSEETDVTITASFATTVQAAGSAVLTTTVTLLPAVPVAAADAYATDEDTTLTVNAASGVLANDTAGSAGAIRATLVTSPSHGSLSLDDDGSFTYTPAGNFAGSDSFTYVAGDNATSSDVATVTLSVTHRIDDELLFSYNGTDGRDGSPETWKVPDGVTAIEVEAFGAQGGTAGNLAPGGLGGRIEVVTAVVPGETLQIRVGGSGILASGADGGYNGGGHGGQYNPGAGGGGGSDVRRGSFTLDERLVAAGGGGGGAWNSSDGGASGTVGENGCSGGGPGGGGGGGATASLPGAGGTASGNATAGGPGASGQGGAGGVGVDESQVSGIVSNGGGGGGGWFGGGGGGGGYLPFDAVTGFVCGGGGGGGSNGAAAGITIQVNENGVNAGHGKVIIRW